MTFLLDENLSYRIAEAFAQLGKSVRHVYQVEELGRGTPDRDILQFIQRNDWRLISLDRRILRPAQRKSEFLSLGCGGYFLKTSSRNQDPWEIVERLVRQWRAIERHSANTQPAYAVLVPQKGVLRSL